MNPVFLSKSCFSANSTFFLQIKSCFSQINPVFMKWASKRHFFLIKHWTHCFLINEKQVDSFAIFILGLNTLLFKHFRAFSNLQVCTFSVAQYFITITNKYCQSCRFSSTFKVISNFMKRNNFIKALTQKSQTLKTF